MRRSTITFVSVGMCVGVILFRLKYEVLGLEGSHQQIKKSIYEAKESIHVLKAEWAHLSDPSRVQSLCIKYLNNGQPLNVKPAKIGIDLNKKKSQKKDEIVNTKNKIKEDDIKEEKDSLDALFETNTEALKIKNIAYDVKKDMP